MYRCKSISQLYPRILTAIAVLCLSAPWAHAGEVVRVANLSNPTQCAEEDNVYVQLIGRGIRHLTIAAIHPAYMPTLRTDHMAADFTGCDMSQDPSYAFAPKDVVLYEDAEYILAGHTYDRFWRSDHVDFKVGETVTRDLHLVQLIRKVGTRRIEILVVYPSDGYWRAKPLPPRQFAHTGYGSSFLIGPIEEDRRPYVALSSIAFEPKTLSFVLQFKSGVGTLRVARATPEGTILDISLPPSSRDTGFAAIRSMFVSDRKADTAIAETIGRSGRRERTPIMDFSAAQAATVTFLRSTESGHNTSAPDLRFENFRR